MEEGIRTAIRILALHCFGCSNDINYNIEQKPQLGMDKRTRELFYLSESQDTIRGKAFHCDCGSTNVKLKY